MHGAGLVGDSGQLWPERLERSVQNQSGALLEAFWEHLETLGPRIGVKCAALEEGMELMSQSLAVARQPHAIVGATGEVMDEETARLFGHHVRFLAPQLSL